MGGRQLPLLRAHTLLQEALAAGVARPARLRDLPALVVSTDERDSVRVSDLDLQGSVEEDRGRALASHGAQLPWLPLLPRTGDCTAVAAARGPP
jgi:hypothetical protein